MPRDPQPSPASAASGAPDPTVPASTARASAPPALVVGPASGLRARVRAAGRLASGFALAPVYRAYAARLRSEVLARPVPHHVALIMDGNRRWARELGLREVRAGHSQGADKAVELLDWCAAIGIREVTLWALSLENLERPAEEVEAITEIARETLDALAARDRGRPIAMSLQVIGRRDLLPDRLREAAERGVAETAGRAGLRVTLALGYSGRDELVEAARAAVRALVAEGTAPDALADALTADRLAAQLYTNGSSDPDLIIRTSGEVRLSGFLPWQSAYSEFYFCEAYWPAFRQIDFLRAIRTYQQRARRFGR